MELAIEEAKKAFSRGDIPVGAVIVKNHKVIAVASNSKTTKNCSFYHAEMLAIEKASLFLKHWMLKDCDMYVTLEPCPMCKAAIVESRLRSVYYLIDSTYKDTYRCCEKKLSMNKIKISDNEYEVLFRKFFEDLRIKSL